MKIYESVWEDQVISIYVENNVDLGGKHLVIKMNQSTEFLPEWTFTNEESIKILNKIKEFIGGSS